MQEYILEITKYVLTVSMTCYSFICIIALLCRSQRRVVYLVQNVLMFIIQSISFLDLFLVSRNVEYIIIYIALQLFILLALCIVPKLYPDCHRLLLNNMCMLLGIGLCIVSRLSLNKAGKQYTIVVASFIVALAVPYLLMKLRFIKRIAWAYAVSGIGILGTVFVMGEVTHGSKISFVVGGLTFQPSEFVKILFVFFLAAALQNNTSLRQLIVAGLFAGIHVIILVISRDLGCALIFYAVFLFVVFVATGKYRYFIAGMIGGSAAACMAYYLFEHVQVRVLAWRDPWSYIDAQGYQITQSLFAVGSGSWFGMGLMRGKPTTIPYVETDFVFSAICEEFGVIFGICVIFVCISCFMAMMQIALSEEDRFYRGIAMGIGIMYIFQIFLTIGGNIKFIPLTGVTLPFVSYGGTSIVVTMLFFFIMQGIYMRKGESTGRKEILVTTALFVALFIGMIGYLGRFVATSEQDMINNSYNPRQKILLERNYRGDILAGDGEVLARTVEDTEGNAIREYPFENLFSHIVGYESKGRMGVEAVANYYLINSNASLADKVKNNLRGKKNPGDTVHTTLNVEIQQIAEEQLGSNQGAVIVTEVKTGKVLAMVSHPNFDPNEIEEIWNSLVSDRNSSVLVNRATQGLYPPGSTFKTFTALEFIRENPEEVGLYRFQCPGFYEKNNSQINCYHGTAHGQLDLEYSFAKSCNASFANIGLYLDKEQFNNTLQELLFGKELPITLAYSKSSVAVKEDMTVAEVMQTVIGQGQTQMTPIHLHMITSAIANNGVLMNPYVIDRVESYSGTIVKNFKPVAYGQIMTSEETQILRKMMSSVVENGTAYKLKELEHPAAGKTGSAEYNNRKEDSHAWFTGFAPADDPQICVTVIVEGAGSGGEHAVPIAKVIFETYLEEK